MLIPIIRACVKRYKSRYMVYKVSTSSIGNCNRNLFSNKQLLRQQVTVTLIYAYMYIFITVVFRYIPMNMKTNILG